MANDLIGVKLAVDGERDFKNALREINQNFKLLGSELALVSSQFDKNDNETSIKPHKHAVYNLSLTCFVARLSLKSAKRYSAIPYVKGEYFENRLDKWYRNMV